ncbi:hypothetical protein SAMN05421505_110162 [Sinosporangium album]|uniref:CDP-Glycerol:Poly(Glycerophosphate) glycerophosphotransferase n=1 Tax=Sinosporangium album TaxID=504805 RepID=A0A1G7Z257_9ACTN|nr:hypothetical protein [Sinosporangium album]SDH02851.1 hypothetical protein SAMN05421505_110162 [Sinosporangium album]
MTYAGRLVKGPFSLAARYGDTNRTERTVVAVVHHFAGATRLLDVLPLVERDERVQTVFTVPPSSVFEESAHSFLRSTGALMMPWAQAVETPFDLALSAALGHLEQLHCPILAMEHGAGPYSYVPIRSGSGSLARRAVISLGARGLVTHGRVIPSALMLPHAHDRELLAQECPEALPAAVVAGDPCLDRMLASRHLRLAYRNALGVGPSQKLVVVTSHFGEDSLLQNHRELLLRLPAELPTEDYRAVVILHPNIWFWHGRRQVAAWFDACSRSRVTVLPPEEGWRAALVAADSVIGDRGSLACYGAALGAPVLLAPFKEENVVPDSLFACLAAIAPRLDPDSPLVDQLEALERLWTPEDTVAVRSRLVSVPGQAARLFRQTMYRLMRLSEPVSEARTEPVPMPLPLRHASS